MCLKPLIHGQESYVAPWWVLLHALKCDLSTIFEINFNTFDASLKLKSTSNIGIFKMKIINY